jgi:glycosyltransferase involved in cell wall biosynthesis
MPVYRILLASQPVDAGVPRHVLDLVSALDPGRFAIDVACPEGSTLWRGLEAMPRVSRHPIVGEREPSPADAASLARLVGLAGRADIVHGHSSKAGFLARLAARLRGRRDTCLFTPHGWSFWSAGGRRADAYLTLERRAAHWCSAILAVSTHERDAGLAAGVGRRAQYRVIPNGVDLERFAAVPAPVPGRVVMIARLAPPKRPDLAVRALARIRDTVSAAELHLVGDGPGRVAVERLAAELGLAAAVHVLGSRDDVPAILASAACLVLATDYEGCPLSVLEAMAAGVPVVAAAVGGVPEVVVDGETGILSPPGAVEPLARAVTELLRDSSLAGRMGASGRERARQRYSLARMAGDTVGVYEELLAARR